MANKVMEEEGSTSITTHTKVRIISAQHSTPLETQGHVKHFPLQHYIILNAQKCKAQWARQEFQDISFLSLSLSLPPSLSFYLSSQVPVGDVPRLPLLVQTLRHVLRQQEQLFYHPKLRSS